MRKSSSSSHAQWQGKTPWKQSRSGAKKGWDDSSPRTSPKTEQVSDEHVTTALHAMQDHLQQTTVISKRRSQKTLCEQSRPRAKGDAAYEALEALTQARQRQEEARRLHAQKCEEAAEAEMRFNGAIKDTLEKADALETHVKTATMTAESPATTEADFFKTFLARQEEAQRDLNELSAQPSQQNTTTRPTP